MTKRPLRLRRYTENFNKHRDEVKVSGASSSHGQGRKVNAEFRLELLITKREVASGAVFTFV